VLHQSGHGAGGIGVEIKRVANITPATLSSRGPVWPQLPGALYSNVEEEGQTVEVRPILHRQSLNLERRLFP
jgi:hypothetical protein